MKPLIDVDSRVKVASEETDLVVMLKVVKQKAIGFSGCCLAHDVVAASHVPVGLQLSREVVL